MLGARWSQSPLNNNSRSRKFSFSDASRVTTDAPWKGNTGFHSLLLFLIGMKPNSSAAYFIKGSFGRPNSHLNFCAVELILTTEIGVRPQNT